MSSKVSVQHSMMKKKTYFRISQVNSFLMQIKCIWSSLSILHLPLWNEFQLFGKSLECFSCFIDLSIWTWNEPRFGRIQSLATIIIKGQCDIFRIKARFSSFSLYFTNSFLNSLQIWNQKSLCTCINERGGFYSDVIHIGKDGKK